MPRDPIEQIKVTKEDIEIFSKASNQPTYFKHPLLSLARWEVTIMKEEINADVLSRFMNMDQNFRDRMKIIVEHLGPTRAQEFMVKEIPDADKKTKKIIRQLVYAQLYFIYTNGFVLTRG